MAHPVANNLKNPSQKTGADSVANFASAIALSATQIHSGGRNLFSEWESGPFAHLNRVAVPEPEAARGFRFAANGHLVDEFLSAKIYCDALTGFSGSGRDQDPIVADLVVSGSLTFTGQGGTTSLLPGNICIRDSLPSWNFSCAPGTRIRVVTIPRHPLLSRISSPRLLNRAHVADVSTPEVRFLLNFLQAVEKSAGDLNTSAFSQHLALDACATILSSMLSAGQKGAVSDHPSALLDAAMNAIEQNLESEALSPDLVAQLLGVSLRTLHRAFADADDSLMAFVRRRRLESARIELLTMGGSASISQLAARWHFSDASHFIRQFKSLYGSTPRAYLRERTKPRSRSSRA